MIGKQISHYRVLEELGRGGMGVVYKAQDTRLDRIVALKFLPHHLTANEAEQARFLQEAKAAAVLNHPNICIIHGIDEFEGQQFIEMEYVEGETLRSRIAKGEMRTGDAIAYAIQIGEALQEAHGKGIVHRDIKTENIMVNSKNKIKVMDFGLAKLKGSLKLTRTSSTVGTLCYMAPEQLRGGEVDARSDIFSFGVVLYEMLTGRTPFRGEHEAALMYSILNEEIEPVQEQRADVPTDLNHVLDTALEKDAEDRYQNVAEMVRDLRRLQKKSGRVSRKSMGQVDLPGGAPAAPPSGGIPTADVSSQRPAPVTSPGTPGLTDWIAAHRTLLFAVSGGVAAFVLLFWVYTALLAPKQALPVEATFKQLTDQPGEELYPDISPDGNFVAYSKRVSGIFHLFLQRIAGGNPIDLTPGTREDNRTAAFSPDGQWLAFRSERGGGGLSIMGATGESVRRLTDFGFDPAWSPDGSELVCATQGVITPYDRPGSSALWAVNVSTGEKRQITKGDGVQPQWSPHGSRIAFWGLPPGTGRRVIFTVPAAGGEMTTLIDDGHTNWDPVWSPDGKYLYFSSDRGGSLNIWRVPVDEQSGTVRGEPEPMTTPSARSGFLKISRDGHQIVYTSIDRRANIEKVSFDPSRHAVVGTPLPVTQGSREYIDINISPDGEWLVFRTAEAQEDVYIVRTDGTNLRQLTNDAFKDRGPAWSPDGKRLAFYSDRSGSYELWMISVDGSGLQQISNVAGRGTPWYPVWFPDGNRLVCGSPLGGYLIDLTKPSGSRVPEPLPRMEGSDEAFQPCSVSRDGLRILGYRSPKSVLTSGIAVYSMETRTYSILSDSGTGPVWLKDNRTILYVRNEGAYIMDSDSRRSHEVYASPANRSLLGARISPDDRTLYLNELDMEADIWMATMK